MARPPAFSTGGIFVPEGPAFGFVGEIDFASHAAVQEFVLRSIRHSLMVERASMESRVYLVVQGTGKHLPPTKEFPQGEELVVVLDAKLTRLSADTAAEKYQGQGLQRVRVKKMTATSTST